MHNHYGFENSRYFKNNTTLNNVSIIMSLAYDIMLIFNTSFLWFFKKNIFNTLFLIASVLNITLGVIGVFWSIFQIIIFSSEIWLSISTLIKPIASIMIIVVYYVFYKKYAQIISNPEKHDESILAAMNVKK